MVHYYPSEARGSAEHGWLHAKHSFSFADFYDPARMGFRSLRVINEDRIEAGKGFPTHPHKDMEIVTYVISGALEHKDSMGNGSIINPGDVQYMSAGSGVLHSEFNHSQSGLTHLLQIWILPDKANYQPRYNQKSFSEDDKKNKLKLVVSGNEKEKDVIHVRQDVFLFTSFLDAGEVLEYKTNPKRGLWLQMVRGHLNVNNQKMNAGDAIFTQGESALKIKSEKDAEFLLFDLG
ncbi:MAG: quercetin 2,3-dioxygenase [Proteobacteria bacterium SG_bin7]|nr:MAG: quercetin 2,3-dioxygenase [Proteobacteria bacterium SG_bin7]